MAEILLSFRTRGTLKGIGEGEGSQDDISRRNSGGQSVGRILWRIKAHRGSLAQQIRVPRAGRFPLGSAQSRAAARAMLEARQESEEGFRVQCYSIVDGKPVNLDGLADSIRAARMKDQTGILPLSLPASEDGQDSSGGRRANCLTERIRMARERATRAQDPVSMP